MYLMIYFLQNIGRMAMKFKTRLLITFLTIILLPIILALTAFLIIGGYLSKGQEDLGLRVNNYNVWIDPAETSRHLSDEIFVEIREGLKQDPHLLEKTDILDAINDDIADKSSYLIVRKGNELYYTGNQLASAQIFDKLPEFNEEDIDSETAQSIYYDDMNKLVRQMDFYFTDGSEGSLFVIMKANSTMSRKLFIDMAVAITLILVLTSLFLTRWISRSVFEPINELNVAMQNIAEGNLEYILPHKDDGEIGDLYRNYEDMRLRLKESADEKILTEKQNKELVSNISHDLKTPITAIKGYVEDVYKRQVPFTGITVTDNLGAYPFGGNTLVPLTYIAGTAKYYVNGVVQATPAVTACLLYTSVSDGDYMAEFNTDSSMFHANEAYDGRGLLTVENGEMTLHVSMPSKNIVNLFVGKAEDAKKSGAKLLEPTTDTVTYSDGTTEEVYGFDVPVTSLDKEFDLALIGKKGVWYDHRVSVSDPQPLED